MLSVLLWSTYHYYYSFWKCMWNYHFTLSTITWSSMHSIESYLNI